MRTGVVIRGHARADLGDAPENLVAARPHEPRDAGFVRADRRSDKRAYRHAPSGT